jgi:histidinol-phosphatase (PHP family)
MWANFHTHSTYCDGKNSLSDIVEAAKSVPLLSLGFSSHAPLPFERGWAMKPPDFDSYLSEIEKMRAVTNTVDVYAGLEVDYVPGKVGPSLYSSRLDYTIGSIHFVDSFDDGDPWEIDNTNMVFMDGLQRIFKGNVRDAIARYFELTREMILKDPPTVIGHIDKIKIQNIDNTLFREEDSWYKKQINDTIEVLKKTECIVEVNTRGIYQKKSLTTYPSPWIIDLLSTSGIPVTISSDAHHPKDLTAGFADAALLLKTCGYNNIHVLREGKWQPYRFDQHGIIC